MFRSRSAPSNLSRCCLLAIAAGLLCPRAVIAAGPVSIVPLGEFSPSFLGMYRKEMLIEGAIARYAARYGVDVSLAKAVCLYESGGNANLRSSAGANGYFQVMPSTFRLMRVSSNIEAGIKYLGQLVKQFGREDYALAGYNGGPGRVATRRSMPLESLQYVIGVGYYRSVLKAYEPSVRAHAEKLKITEIRAGEDWWALSRRLHIPAVQVRLHNPFLAARPVRAGDLVAYPEEPRSDLFTAAGSQSRYRTGLGDNYMKVAFTLGVNLDRLRQANGLWRLQPLLNDTELTIPVDVDGLFTEYIVQPGDNISSVAAGTKADPWEIVRDNALWSERLVEGAVIRIRQHAVPAARAIQTHAVRRGDTLRALAGRYHVSVGAIQGANGLGKRTTLRIGQRLRIPVSAAASDGGN